MNNFFRQQLILTNVPQTFQSTTISQASTLIFNTEHFYKNPSHCPFPNHISKTTIPADISDIQLFLLISQVTPNSTDIPSNSPHLGQWTLILRIATIIKTPHIALLQFICQRQPFLPIFSIPHIFFGNNSSWMPFHDFQLFISNFKY